MTTFKEAFEQMKNYKEQEMTLNNYQKKAMETCMPSCDNISYMLLNLVGEVGEFSGKLAKQIRKGNITIGGRYSPNSLQCRCPDDSMIELNTELMYEAGDILWQLSGLCEVMGWKLDDIAKMNIEKLQSRKCRGVIDGNGDYR